MKIIRRRIVRVKLIVISFAAVFAIFGFLSFSAKFERANASASGPATSHTNAPNEGNCTECHASFPVNSGTGKISISTLPVNYLPNQKIPITVTVSQSDAVIYGFQLTAIDNQGKKVGSYTLPAQSPPQLQVLNGFAGGNQRQYIEHTVDGVVPTQFGSKSWTFTWNAPTERVGKISFYAAGNAANSDGSTSGDYIYTTAKSTLSGTAISNFDGDGKSDVAVFRPSTGEWFSLKSSDGSFQSFQFGANGDKSVAGDFDGDGKSDFAVWRPSNGVWYIMRSSDGAVQYTQFGISTDKPVIGDYDGDGKTDIAVYRPSTGIWYLLQSRDGFSATQFGLDTDKTAQGDYDGDGKTDIAVFRPSTGVWYIQKSRDGFSTFQFGLSGDKPVPADYDGDGRTDIALYRPANGVWYLQKSRDGFGALQFGASNDKPAPADYDGDGRTDIAVYRPSEGLWYILRADNSYYGVSFGSAQDIPVPSGFIAE
ncbi:MAG: FG-GAP-like repeat-containing protein [Acidobacteriota bacterium]|nr:FG-GAP-like repeat-containing protein [Acidobacteriota bacterium]